MKQILMIVCALMLAMSAQAKNKVIHRPAYVSNTAMYELRPMKVEVSKKATVVHFHVVNAKWGGWGVAEARLVCNGDTLAFKSGRVITHDGTKVLADEPFELGKNVDRNVQRDSLIMTFEPLPKGAETFDYLGKSGRRKREIKGIRLSEGLYPSLLPADQPFVDDGQPLKPLKMGLGEASATIRAHGGGTILSHNDWRNFWGQLYRCSNDNDSVIVYRSRDYLRQLPFFSGCGFGLVEKGVNTQFPLLLIPGETLTLDIDLPAVTARNNNMGDRKVTMRDCYRVGGTIGDINQVLLENQELMYSHYYMEEIPECTEGETFAEWSERLWQSLDAFRQKLQDRHPDYTRRQREFLRIWVEDVYVCSRIDYAKTLKDKMGAEKADSVTGHLKETYTLVDPHFKDMLIYQGGRTFYFPAHVAHIPYLEANGFSHSEVCQTLKALDYKDRLVKRMNGLEVLSDSDILAANPQFQTPLREYNDSIRLLVERLQREAQKRMMPPPDATGDKLLETIAAQHPGKAVFFDLWATWCTPCKIGISAMEPLKEKLKDSDIVFVYLTNETSPEADWKKQVGNIPGLHYRVTDEIWKQIPNITAIPQYYLYDCEGRRQWEQTGYDEQVLKDIEQQIGNALK
ncbi:MAG: TlpA family protein disulfide reductase [Prevotella sp.]|nr:TlpA family protein disulfide reductase [Prevotella sp.]